jgi:uridine kinase
LKRAIKRNIEKLSQEALIEDYNTYYYPAQRLHIESDNPRQSADIVFNNDCKQ